MTLADSVYERYMKVPSVSSMDHSPNTSRSRSREPTVRTTDEMTEISPASPQRGRRQRGPSQKAMLSKALQKANTAVLLDNAANFQGAIDAYNEACQLLQLVMVRSSGSDEEKTKLLEIQNTYTIRIKELRRLDIPLQQPNDKALPQRPLSDQSLPPDMSQSIQDNYEDNAVIETSSTRRIVDYPPRVAKVTKLQLPTRRESLLPSAFEEATETGLDRLDTRTVPDVSLNKASDNVDEYIMPLSPRRNFIPDLPKPQSDSSQQLPALQSQVSQDYVFGNESTSWLDTIDESTASSPVSAHSKLSIYLRRRQSRRISNGTEAEFDAALDAAVEAAYDEGLEPAMDMAEDFYDDHEDDDDNDDTDDVVTNARRNIEIAKQRVREAEREAQAAMARGLEQRRIQEEAMLALNEGAESDYIDEEAEEEERLLEEMTQGYVMDDFEFDLHAKSALPRQSDSSTFSGRTWGSSVASNPATAGTSLSTLAEGVVLPPADTAVPTKRLPPPPRIPSGGPPGQSSQSIPLTPPSAGVRARRLSGQNMKQLKIDTNRPLNSSRDPQTEPASIALPSPPPPLPQDELKTSLPVQNSATSNIPSKSAQYPRPERKVSVDSFKDEDYGMGLTKIVTQESEDLSRSNAPSPSRPIGKVPSIPDILRKNTSSSSLRAMRTRNVSISTPDISADSPSTPSSSFFPTFDFQRGNASGFVPALPTPTGATFTTNGMPTGGLYLFDNNIHSPSTPGSPNPAAANAPIPLEPCPESYLLRPFWLMRCLYQTIAHPRGGYLSTKLFVPRDVWRVKNVKIKAFEDKVSLCDLLTAALLKLAQVDTYDADAILEEMQAFENILDQVQTSFAKKLGNEVGVHGSLSLFKSLSTSDDPSVATENSSSRSSNSAGKSYLTSWRKLRSKSSAAANTNGPLYTVREGGKENLTLSTVPMTAAPTTRATKRNVTQLQFTGPNANYMGALARLFDAAQVLDQIARQVEDPGLKHSSPTHVGLELSTRHAAEFFGFFVCRFALNDIGILLDKFIKRGSEWVLM